MATEFVPGIFSNVGRVTDKELTRLRHHVQLSEQDPHLDAAAYDDAAAALHGSAGDAGGDPKGASRGVASKVRSAAKKNRPPPPGQDAAGEPMGDLARLIEDKLRANRGGQSPIAPRGSQQPDPPGYGSGSADAGAAASQRPTAAFGSVGVDDGPWASKFTAAASPGALNRWNEQRPDPGWYKVTYGMVHGRYPSWDFSEHPRTKSLKAVDENGVAEHAATGGTGDGCFLTGVDHARDDASLSSGSSPQAARRRPLTGQRLRHEPMTLAAPRPELAKVGRVTVQYHEVTDPAKDALSQDIKGYRKHRYPEWDFGKDAYRPDQASDERGDPGKYEVMWGCVEARTKSGIAFDKAMTRDAPVTTLGKLAPQAVLHPDEKRAPGGCVADRSKAKDCVRKRITNVNDFQRELARPPLGKQQDEGSIEHALTFDADRADVAVTSRRDVAPIYARMLPRGRAAVQGNRALSSDLGVRGAVGLDGIVETTGLREEPVARLESRAADSRRERPDAGPRFDHSTQFEPTLMHNNFVHGAPKVYGAGSCFERKRCHLRGDKLSKSVTTFQREKSGPGFTATSKLGGTLPSQRSRSFAALPDWSSSIRGVH